MSAVQLIEIYLIGSLLGLSLGSFLNVCAYRVPRGISIVTGRSFCPHCRSQLRWLDLIPIFSFLALRGRCATCKQAISPRYVLLETASAAGLVLSLLAFGLSGDALAASFFTLLMLLVSVVDWELFAIPNTVIICGLVTGLLLKAFFFHDDLAFSLMSMAAAFILMLALQESANHLFGKPALGMGDVKLAAVIALFLGFWHFLIALWIASVIGGLLGLANRVSRSHKAYASEALPMGSFLALSSIVVMFTGGHIDKVLLQWLI